MTINSLIVNIIHRFSLPSSIRTHTRSDFSLRPPLFRAKLPESFLVSLKFLETKY